MHARSSTWWINHDKDLLDLTIRTGDGHTATLHTTANHPFWDETLHTWISAGELHKGDALNTATDHHAYVVATRPTLGSANRWNLTVQQLHTYYVLAGETPVLVHNKNCDATGRGLWQLTREGSEELLKGGPFRTTFYQSASDGTWWTPDVTGHGESAFKVYRETSKGLEWISDADKYGTYMPDKWKGETGKFIPNSDLRGVKG